MHYEKTVRRELWAISCYFNPAGYRTRRNNYRLFRQRLATPLLTVEWSPDGRFELEADDADILLQLSGGSILWQKERLLNLALTRLPGYCRQVAWIDCDVVFGRDDWWVDAAQALDNYAVVQLYQDVIDLPRNHSLQAIDSCGDEPSRDGVASLVHRGKLSAHHLAHRTTGRQRATGFAWAASRETIEKHGLYDAMIMGGGDTALVIAAFGCFAATRRRLRLNGTRHRHYLGWARPFHRSVRGSVGYLPGTLYHLWHGELVDRRYGFRHRLLEQLRFDPLEDVEKTESGCWQWATDKKLLHEGVRDFFHQRKEDGAELDASRGALAAS